MQNPITPSLLPSTSSRAASHRRVAAMSAVGPSSLPIASWCMTRVRHLTLEPWL